MVSHPFHRPSVRYGETPEPVTPYQKAAQVWDERLGSARVQAANWRLAALSATSLSAMLGLTVLLIVGRSSVVPYVVEVDRLGEVRAVGPAIEAYQPSDAQIAHFLARFIENVRSLSVDPVIVRYARRIGRRTREPHAARLSGQERIASSTSFPHYLWIKVCISCKFGR